MNYSWKTYVMLGATGLASFIVASVFPTTEFLRGFLALPGVVALLGVLYTLWRDHVSHERTLEAQRHEHDFALSVVSHMAEVVFDRHAEFAEKYIRKLNDSLQSLFASGPTGTAIQFAQDLRSLRADYATWLSQEIENRLIPLEHALVRIGADSNLLEHLRVGEKRTEVVNRMHDALGVVIGLQEPANDQDAERAATTIIQHLRGLIGVQEFTELRRRTLDFAIRRLHDERQG